MAKRVVRAALWEYRDANGQRRRAFFGQEVDLPESEVERGERQGVFGPKPTPDDEIVEHTPAPNPTGEDTLPVPPHDVTGTPPAEPTPEPTPVLAPIEQSAVGGAQPEIVKTEAVTEASAPKRPAKAASVAVWRDYIAAVRPELADEVAGMDKDELQAQAPKDD